MCNSILWQEVVSITIADPLLFKLASTIEHGFPIKQCELSSDLLPYWPIRASLEIESGVVWCKGRIIVPESLRPRVLEILHSAHQGVSSMEDRARTIVYWPGMSNDIAQIRNGCRVCCKNAPSQAPLPAKNPEIPATPFEAVFADFFSEQGHHYLVVGDRLSGWVEVYSSRVGSSNAGATGLITHLRTLFTTFGIPISLSSDGGPEFAATATAEFLSTWGVHHRMSSAHNPQSNGRAEVAVKKAKRLLKSCVGPSGSLNNDRFMRGMLQLRNTPDPECKLSPAEILFGRQLRDAFGFINRCNKFSNPEIQLTWREAWAAKEDALRVRFAKTAERLNAHARQLPQLEAGQRVFIQNQDGAHPNKWDRSGMVLENHGNDQYSIKVDGTGRVTKRNRRYLRRYTLPQGVPLNMSTVVPINLSSQVPSAPMENIEESRQSLNIPILDDRDDEHPSILQGENADSPATPDIVPINLDAANEGVPVVIPIQNKRGRGRPPKQKQKFRGYSATPQTSSPSPPPSSPPPVQKSPPPTVSVEQDTTRPKRVRCGPKTYDASSGKWT